MELPGVILCLFTFLISLYHHILYPFRSIYYSYKLRDTNQKYIFSHFSTKSSIRFTYILKKEVNENASLNLNTEKCLVRH